MRRRFGALLLTAALACGVGGCGTAVNLWSPPECCQGMGPTTCFAFGGVTRSAMLGGFMLVGGPCTAVEEFGQSGLVTGAGMTALGALALVDVPLSLAGDLVTLPVAYARSRNMPWATWWGEQSQGPLTPPAPSTSTEASPGHESGAPALEESAVASPQPAQGGPLPVRGAQR
jgi:hypothetical protein